MSKELESENCAPSQQSISNLSKLHITKLLSQNSQRKTISVLGTFEGSEDKAVVFLEKEPFKSDTLPQFCSKESVLENIFLNDIYGSYSCFPETKLNGIKTTIIYPATDKHISKYEEKPIHIIYETPELYHSVTLPHITKEQLGLQWVYNILEHKKETERIVYEDFDELKGFILLPDLKWSGKQIEDLYLLAIVQTHDIKSLRDLNSEHLPLLRNILDKGTEIICEKYGLKPDQLRIYIHYQPSFYHLHVHFTYLSFDAPGINVGKAHLLNTVIDNIELVEDYYQKATLPFVVNESHSLYPAFKKIDYFGEKKRSGQKRKFSE